MDQEASMLIVEHNGQDEVQHGDVNIETLNIGWPGEGNSGK